MSVNLSPLGGAGWQFFDDNGVPLAGGKIFTYAAGTTTPAATYTSNSGGTAHSNPIILDAAGRVAEEIWLSVDQTYKFLLKDANDVLIGTYDNIYGIVGADIPGTVNVENFTGNGTQTVFILAAPPGGVNNTQVFINGVYQFKNTYSVSGTTLTFTQAPPPVASSIEVLRFSTFSVGTLNADQVIYDPAGTGAVATTVQAKLRETVSVKDFGAVGDGVADDSAAFNAMFATGSNTFELIAGEQYLIGDVVLPTGSGWTVEGNWATIIPKAGALTCLTGTYTVQTFNTAIKNLNVSGDVTDVIKLVCTGNGVLLNCEINGITSRSGTCTTLVTLESTAIGQGEAFKVKNVTILGADYDYVVYMFGGTSNYGSCEFKTIFHNHTVGVATILAADGLFLADFDLIYHTRGSGVKINSGKSAVSCKFRRMETEAVEHDTLLYDGEFVNCSFDISTVYNQLLSAPYTEQIASGVFKNCTFSNNFVFQTSGTTMTFAAGSTRNTVSDLLVGSIDYVRYDTISDAGTFNNFVGEQYTSPSSNCTGAITSSASYTLVKNGQMVTLDLPAVSGVSTAATSFSFGTALPAKYRPAAIDSSVSAFIIDAGGTSNVPGLITVATSGVVSVFKSGNQTDTYTAGTTSGLAQSVTLSWIL